MQVITTSSEEFSEIIKNAYEAGFNAASSLINVAGGDWPTKAQLVERLLGKGAQQQSTSFLNLIALPGFPAMQVTPGGNWRYYYPAVDAFMKARSLKLD